MFVFQPGRPQSLHGIFDILTSIANVAVPAYVQVTQAKAAADVAKAQAAQYAAQSAAQAAAIAQPSYTQPYPNSGVITQSYPQAGPAADPMQNYLLLGGAALLAILLLKK